MKRSRDYILETPTKYSRSSVMDQGTGNRRAVTRGVVSGRTKFSDRKVLRGGIGHIQYTLGYYNSDTPDPGSNNYKYLVSEFDPNKSGMISICKKIYNGTTISDDAHAQLPMHVYDLNYIPYGTTADAPTGDNLPYGTNQCEDINSRFWKWSPGDKFIGGHNPTANLTNTTGVCRFVRWRADNSKFSSLPADKTFIYRKNIDIKFQLYGCAKMATEFDVRVIRITDPRMCPDFPGNLIDTTTNTDRSDVKQAWQNLMLDYTVNPMLKGEPGPFVKKWFETVAKKRVRIGEQTSEVESVPCVAGSIRVNINRNANYAWNMNKFDVGAADDIAQGIYDNVLKKDDDQQSAFCSKPYYTQRYYLVIRALCPVDTTTNIGTNLDENLSNAINPTFESRGHNSGVFQYIPTYDLMVKHRIAVINGV